MFRDERVRAIAVSLVVLVSIGFLIRTQLGDQRVKYDGVQLVYDTSEISRFESAEEFKAYLAEAADMSSMNYLRMNGVPVPAMEGSSQSREDAVFDVSESDGKSNSPERVSQTNVQVGGIDEPDILKTNGESIFYAQPHEYWYYDDVMPMVRESEAVPLEGDQAVVDSKIGILPPPERAGQTRILDAFPPEDLAEVADIEATGDLLLVQDRLLVLSQGQSWYEQTNSSIRAFDVSDPKAPESLWEISMDASQQLQSARLFGEDLFVVYRRYVDESSPCPFPLYGERTLSCSDIYHPRENIGVDTTYTLLKIDTKTGETLAQAGFLGSASASILYMSEAGLYISYSQTNGYTDLMIDFYLETEDLFPAALRNDLRRVRGYELSDGALMAEVSHLVETWLRTLDSDESRRIENETQDRLEEYYQSKIRELESTSVVRFALSDLKLVAVGTVPGTPLNQFSLDEYQGNLRIAVTLGENLLGSSGSVSDVYILDEGMEQLGSIQNLGEGEQIYSVRFLEDQGYLVTFRQTDPFYVLDLADPRRPEKTGELKIPGYSSYLHPLTADLILGVGQEDWRVKLAMFDVSDPSNPEEQDKYLLDASWSEVGSTHHAFLLDTENEIFFLPADQDGYVFSYADAKFRLEKVVTGIGAKRALFLDNYLYLIGDQGIVVLNESDWSTVKEMTF